MFETKTAWLQNKPEDYQRLGLKPHEVEPWEDGKQIERSSDWIYEFAYIGNEYKDHMNVL